MKALILGLFDNGDDQNLQNVGTTMFDHVDSKSNGKLKEHVQLLGTLKLNKIRIITKFLSDYPIVIVVGLGSINANFDEIEELNVKKDNIRKAIASAVSTIRSLESPVTEVHFDPCDDAESVAIGAIVSDWRFDEFKCENLKRKLLKFSLATSSVSKDLQDWTRGSDIANMQNECRRLQELPANRLTPTSFCEEAKKLCEPLGVKVVVRDKQWAEKEGMNAFLSVSKGSDQPPKFLEIHYMNAGEKRPLVFVGKGVTFDSGGISLKPPLNMDLQRGDMSGGAMVLCSIATLAKWKSKVNVIGLIPLTENLINGSATKPGDVVCAMNGKSIQIDNTDAEGRLILSDALCYADIFGPEIVVDIATLTGACKIALGVVAGAVFTTNKKYLNLIKEAGSETGDRLVNLPLYSEYSKLVKDSPLADLINTSKDPGSGAGTIAAAMFLKEFTKCDNWMHVDMAGIKHTNSSCSLGKGMTGRPLSTMIKFIQKVFS